MAVALAAQQFTPVPMSSHGLCALRCQSMTSDRMNQILSGLCRFDSPRSVRHLMSADRQNSGDSSSGEDPIPVNKYNPGEIRTDGSGTTLKGEHSSFVIEIIDPGQKNAPPATSLEQMHVAPGDDLLDNILNRYTS